MGRSGGNGGWGVGTWVEVIGVGVNWREGG